MHDHFGRNASRLLVLMTAAVLFFGTTAVCAEQAEGIAEAAPAAARQTDDTPDAAGYETTDTPDRAEPQPAESPFKDVDDVQRLPKLGDLDSDGIVTASDALIVLRVGVGLRSGQTESYPAGDIDHDYLLSASDALTILRYSIGLTDTLSGSVEESAEWKLLDGVYYAYGADGEPLCGLETVEGFRCCFDENGRLITGNTSFNGMAIHALENGVIPSGWQITEKGRSFYKDGEPLDGVCTVYGDRYCFKKGIACTGWHSLGGATAYYGENGAALTGWQMIDGVKYYFLPDGVIATGSLTLGGITYSFANDGELQNGWVDNNSERSFIANYELVTGEFEIDGDKYLFDESGILRTGFRSEDGKPCLFNSFGFPCGGWAEDGKDKYYFNSDGTPANGFVTIDGTLYCFKNGVMLKDTTVKLYKINSEGVCTKVKTVKPEQAIYRAEEIVETVGKDPGDLCRYVIEHMTYMFIYIPQIYTETPETAAWDSVAAEAMNKGYGACYHYSAFLDTLYHAAGYETQLVVGTGYGTNLHSWNMIKLNGKWVNYDCGEQFFGVTSEFLKSVNWTYNHVFTREYE